MNGQPEDIEFFDAGPPEWGMTLDQAARDRARSDDPVAINQAKKEILFEKKARRVRECCEEFIRLYSALVDKRYRMYLHDIQKERYLKDQPAFGDDEDGPYSFYRTPKLIAIAESRYDEQARELSSLRMYKLLNDEPSFKNVRREYFKREPQLWPSCLHQADVITLREHLGLALVRIIAGGLLVYYTPEKYEDYLADVSFMPSLLPSNKSSDRAKKLLKSLRDDGLRSRNMEYALNAIAGGKLPPDEVDPVRFNEKLVYLKPTVRRNLLIRECDLVSRRLLRFPNARTARFPAEIIDHIITLTGHPPYPVRKIQERQAADVNDFNSDEIFPHPRDSIGQLT